MRGGDFEEKWMSNYFFRKYASKSRSAQLQTIINTDFPMFEWLMNNPLQDGIKEDAGENGREDNEGNEHELINQIWKKLALVI